MTREDGYEAGSSRYAPKPMRSLNGFPLRDGRAVFVSGGVFLFGAMSSATVICKNVSSELSV